MNKLERGRIGPPVAVALVEERALKLRTYKMFLRIVKVLASGLNSRRQSLPSLAFRQLRLYATGSELRGQVRSSF